MAKHKILLGLTTTPRSDWRRKIREIDQYGIKIIALFPTFLKIEERKELYELLDRTGLRSIPHVHLRDDTEEWELEYYIKRYKTEVFNIHAQPEVIDFLRKNKKYKDWIYVENGVVIDDMFKRTLELCAGICLDVSHWHDQGVMQGNFGYSDFQKLFKRNKIGCCHISAMTKRPLIWYNEYAKKQCQAYSRHYLKKIKELDYIRDYVKYLPETISIELENPFKEQLKVKRYLEKIINSA